MKFSDYLFRYAEEKGDSLLFSCDDRKMTYGEGAEEIKKRSYFLKKIQVKGKVTALYFTDPAEQLLYFLSVQAAGGIPVLVHEYLKEEDIHLLLKERPIDLFISDKEFPSLSMKKENSLYVRENGNHGENGDFGVLTSGSTGIPKIFFRRGESWSDFFPLQNRIFEVDGKARLFLHGSLAFTGNLNMAMAFLAEGSSLYCTSRLLPKAWLQTIKNEEITHAYLIPSKLSPLSKVKVISESLKYILTGSQLMTAVLFHRLEKVFPHSRIILYYGASELSYISYIEGNEILQAPDSVGKPFPGISISIRNEEIWVDTPYGVEGIDRPYTCHDLGRMDEMGHLHFLGRREDMYHIQGNHVARQKVLAHLLMIPGIEEAEILSIKKENGDDSICAFLSGNVPDGTGLVHILSENLHPWEIPSRFVKVPAIPRTSTGKTDRKKLLSLIK